MNNHAELCLLSQQFNPVAMCLQETHIVDESKVSFKGYTLYNKLDHSHERASGGSSVLVRNDIIHSPVQLNTNIQAVAVKITLSFVFTLCSIYAPPTKYIDLSELQHLLSPPMRAWGVKSRMCPPYPQRDRKRRLNGAVCRNHRIKRVVPCRC